MSKIDRLTKMLTRSVKVFDEEGTLLRTDTPDSTYFWRLTVGTRVTLVNADLALPCLKVPESDDPVEIVGTIEKVGLPNKEVKYGPAPITAAQYAAWSKVTVTKLKEVYDG